jgi:hypothetical protein
VSENIIVSEPVLNGPCNFEAYSDNLTVNYELSVGWT